MQRILILGASSFVGSHIAMGLRNQYEVIGTYNHSKIRIDGVTPVRMPLSSTGHIADWIRLLKPDTTVYCAAIIDERQIHRDPIAALNVNTEVPSIIANEMRRLGGRFVYLSTSKVFAGDGSGFHTEWDEPRPGGAYGSTKRKAELLFEMMSGAFILRLGTIYGLGSFNHSSDIVSRILRKSWKGEEQRLIFDEYRSFFPAESVAKAVQILAGADPASQGIYHLANEEKDSYYSFAKSLAMGFGFSSDSLMPIKGAEFQSELSQSGGFRGADLTLSGKRFTETFEVKWESLAESIWRMKETLLPSPALRRA